MRKLWRRPSPAMVVACAALLVALSGTGMAAATQLARNSVGTPQLKDGAVTNSKIKNNAVNSAKVAARSLLRSDFAPGQLPAGPVGPQGPAGPTGAAGPAGPAGAIGAVTVRQASVVVPGSGADGRRRRRRPQHAVGHPDRRRELQFWRARDVGRHGLERGRERPRARDRLHEAGLPGHRAGHRIHGEGREQRAGRRGPPFTLYVLCYAA